MSQLRDTRFKDKDGNRHLIDHGGNHFINGECVNPCKTKWADEIEGEIGDTHPPEDERLPNYEITYSCTEEEHRATIASETKKRDERLAKSQE